MPCGATQDGRVTVERSDRMWSPGEGNGKPLQYSCLENPMNSMKRQNDRILKEELPRSLGAQCATGDQWRNNSRKNEGTEPKQKQYPVVESWNSSTLATSCEGLTHWKRLWCWEGLGAGGEGDNRGWDGWMASPTRWTWVCVNSGSWWWTGRPGVLRFMGSQRVECDWTELNWRCNELQNSTTCQFCAFHLWNEALTCPFCHVSHWGLLARFYYLLCPLQAWIISPFSS